MKGRPVQNLHVRHSIQVSIHAPVKGRLLLWCGVFGAWRFNPRPREGATTYSGTACARMASFNPRPREGATIDELIEDCDTLVSIHAPVKGRPKVQGRRGAGARFNPRPREGATITL